MYEEEQIKRITIKMGQLYDSPILEIMKKTGKSRPTIGHFFNRDKPIRPSLTELFYDTCYELIEEKQQQHLHSVNKRNKTLVKQSELLKKDIDFNPFE